MPYPLQIVTAATTYPVSPEQARTRCRIAESDYWNTLLQGFIESETARAERVLNLRLMPQVLRLTFDGFALRGEDTLYCGSTFLLPGPVQSLVTFVYDDIDAVEQTVDSSLYLLDTSGSYGRLGLTDGSSWPDTAIQQATVRITYNAGYASADEIPAEIKNRILDAVMFRFDGKDDPEKLDALFEYCRT